MKTLLCRFWRWLCDLEIDQPDYIYPDKRGFIRDAKNIERDFRTAIKYNELTK